MRRNPLNLNGAIWLINAIKHWRNSTQSRATIKSIINIKSKEEKTKNKQKKPEEVKHISLHHSRILPNRKRPCISDSRKASNYIKAKSNSDANISTFHEIGEVVCYVSNTIP